MKQVENSFRNQIMRKLKSIFRMSPKQDTANCDGSSNGDKNDGDPANEGVELSNAATEENKKDR